MVLESALNTSGIGSLTAHSNEDCQFVGSSSDDCFIRTVKHAESTTWMAQGQLSPISPQQRIRS
ncbi:hypothetical protein PDIG_51560 [Penicillium digitatum PHI26]|uniref:Uncharacterized protein n=2 Tax=Penicillium digitatum TaxID=36651 RepID=K9FQ73_PEND2|nr:hypothetical protein PDIP_20760 [Penicillium digitatum Pd1]EKV11319.1 hypothetical protein PDIG_51560 [Penicillium digitatum PHI26]EKV19919.1 hypothetical protein PDIP_20760 [Penicillium digitatum Pd1]